MSKRKTKREETPEVTTEENENTTPIVTEVPPPEETDTAEVDNSFQEVVEVPWEEVENVMAMRSTLQEAEDYTSKFLLDVEKRKTALVSRISEIESALYQQAQFLKESKNLNPDWTFELKLPEKTGDKAYFVRKEEV